MNQNIIYYPCFALLLLTMLVLLRMGFLRFSAMKSGAQDARYFKTYTGASESHISAQAARNFTNLFEVPTLFYVVCLFGLTTHMIDYLFLGLAWAYVFLRYVHSYVHLTSNALRVRMSLYLLSCAVLFVMAVKLLLNVT